MGYQKLARVFKNSESGVTAYHVSVLKNEAVDLLNVKQDGKYIDCTLGGGGHTFEILRRGGKVLGIDTDSDSLNWVRQEVNRKFGKEVQSRLCLVKGNFRNIKKIAREYGFNQADGILYDLGVSTHQLKEGKRGFSFGQEANLDMRLNQESGLSALEVINTKSKEELYEIFTKYGEEKRAWEIADAVTCARLLRPIKTTTELAGIVLSKRGKEGIRDRTHPATRIFQALRIYVNDELNSLKESLSQIFEVIRPGGRMAVISFHSLEDRIVKLFIDNQVREKKLIKLIKKPIRPSEEEIMINPSSRSGKLRGAEVI